MTLVVAMEGQVRETEEISCQTIITWAAETQTPGEEVTVTTVITTATWICQTLEHLASTQEATLRIKVQIK